MTNAGGADVYLYSGPNNDSALYRAKKTMHQYNATGYWPNAMIAGALAHPAATCASKKPGALASYLLGLPLADLPE
jgi:hypothetical protein